MRYALVINGVVDTISMQPQNAPWRTAPDTVFGGWLLDGDEFSAPPARALTVEDYEEAIQAHVDQTARSRLFRDGVTLASYVASTNPQWAAEAVAFVAWRDAVWAHAYAELAKVQAGERAQPTVAEVLAELPVISWA